jgi:hypothetical protein
MFCKSRVFRGYELASIAHFKIAGIGIALYLSDNLLDTGGMTKDSPVMLVPKEVECEPVRS